MIYLYNLKEYKRTGGGFPYYVESTSNVIHVDFFSVNQIRNKKGPRFYTVNELIPFTTFYERRREKLVQQQAQEILINEYYRD